MSEYIRYQCPKCDTVYKTEDDAKICEYTHQLVEDVRIVSLSFAKMSNGGKEVNVRKIPSKIVVRLSDDPAHIATYRLDHMGTRRL